MMAKHQTYKTYSVFFSFNTEDHDAVEKIAVYLSDNVQLRPWFDQWELIPGEPWVQNLERGLAVSSTCAVFVGKSGKGPWQKREVEAALRKQTEDPNFRVIPVLLPDAPKQPELPTFLSGNMWVNFQKGLDDDDALWRLECGILGKTPGRGRSKIIPNYAHCLRQEFTEWIVLLLKQRSKSINLIGRKGIGCRRLLEDIQNANLPNTKTIFINIRNYRENYAGLIREMHSQLGKKGYPPQNLSEVIEICENTKGQIIILFHNFDTLLNNMQNDPKYNITFINALNSIKNQQNIAFMCNTQKPFVRSSILFIQGKPYQNLRFDLEPINLPELTDQAIIDELNRRNLPLREVEKLFTISSIQAHQTPYHFLEYLSEKFLAQEDESLVLQDRLKKWEKDFKYRKTLLSPSEINKIRQRIKVWITLQLLNSKIVKFQQKCSPQIMVLLT